MKHAVAFSGLLVLAGCDAPAQVTETTSELESEVVYGRDDRKDVYELEGALRDVAVRSVVAIFPPQNLDERDPSSIKVKAARLGRALNLCPAERYLDEPVAASCSGTLVDDDLVLTAGHCFGHAAFGVDPEQLCQGRRFVFGYYNEAPGVPHAISSDDVFSCTELVGYRDDIAEQRDDMKNTGSRVDFALVRLERPATPRFAPVRLSVDPSRLVPGAPLTVLGFPSGVPLKAAGSGAITKIRAQGDFFRGTVDTFAGNSGSGVFDSRTLEQIGVLVSGEPDYQKTMGTCTMVARCDQKGCDGRRSERITQIQSVLAEHCGQPFAHSSALCERPRLRTRSYPVTSVPPRLYW